MTKDEFRKFVLENIEEGMSKYADDAKIVGGVFFQAADGATPGTANFTFPSRLHCAAALQAISSDFLRQEIDEVGMQQAMLAQMMQQGLEGIGAGAAADGRAEGQVAAQSDGHLILPDSGAAV